MTQQRAGAIAAFALIALPFPVSGHHSPSEYDQSVVLEFEGEVTRTSWRNPHILYEIATTDASGAEIVWNLEGAAVSAQTRRGVTADLVKEGDRVRVAGFGSMRRPLHMHVNHLLLPTGVEVLLGSVREPRWSDTGVGTGGWEVDPERAATAEGQGIYRVWSRDVGTWYFRTADNYRLTESAAAVAAEWNEFEDNPLLDCTAPGMPSLMGNPYPMEFVEADGNIELRFEEFDVVRVIHLDVDDSRVDRPASPLGYSVGHWEGDTLVLATTGINWPHFDRVGIPLSEAVEIHERFTAIEDDRALHYEMTVTDPETLLEPFTWEGRWVWRPGEVVAQYQCTLEE